MDRDHSSSSTRTLGTVSNANGTPVTWGQRTWDEGSPPPPTISRSVPFGELLAIAVLTPAQAALVMSDLLDASVAAPPGRVHAIVRSDGAVAVTPPDPDVPPAPLQELLDELVRNARRLPAHPTPHQLLLLHHVEEQAGASSDPVDRAAALREALTQMDGADAVVRVRRELVAVVEALNGMAVSSLASSVRINGQTVGHAPAVPPAPPAPARQPGSRRRRLLPRRPRTGRLVAILVVLALVLLGGGYLFLRGPASGLLDSLRGIHHPPAAHARTPSNAAGHRSTGHAAVHHKHAFPALAAHAAGPVHGVVLQKATACTPGTLCGVTVTVHLAPTGAGQVVGWRVGVVHRCARHVTWSPETTVTAQPGWTHVFASSSVQIPKGRSLGLVVLTSAPAHAQSQTVPVSGTALSC